MNTTVAEIAGLVGGSVVGDETATITGMTGIRQAGKGDLSFVSSARYAQYLVTTEASAVLVPEGMTGGSAALIQVADPYVAFLTAIQRFMPFEPSHPKGIHPTAVVGENVKLGENVGLDAHVRVGDGAEIGDGVSVGAGSYIGVDCKIGPGTVIYPNVTVLDRTRMGARCILHSGVVLGADGFGFAPGASGLRKIPQMGVVVLGDDVEIGANSAVDRATFGATMVANGTKIDNLVQIGHNVELGEHCIVCGNAGIAGSARLGKGVTVAAGAGVSGHIEIGDNVTIAGLSGVTKSIEPGRIVSGFPAIDHERDRRIQASQRRLPEALRQLHELQRRIEALEGRLNGKSEDDS